jgi:hypothetical protein
MAYVERDDRDLDLNQQSDFYDDEIYYEVYETENFGERVDSGSDGDALVLDEEEMIVEKPTKTASTKQVEDGFGEAINPSSNPHLNDQLEDDQLSSEAESEYSETGNSGFLQKARGKLDEWTEESDRE